MSIILKTAGCRWRGGSWSALLFTLAVLGGFAGNVTAGERPNIVFLLVDDMGYGDLSSYGNDRLATPHIDRLAREGTQFRQFYVAAPICSASRTGFMTGQFPTRHRITSFLASRRENRARDMADYLDPAVATLPRLLQQAGYATAHFGKWHLGGGRDVDDAPHPSAYGFDRSVVSFEGLGDRVLIPDDKLSRASAALGQGEIRWAPKAELAETFVDEALTFIAETHGPFFLQLWFNDPHAPWLPAEGEAEAHRAVSANPDERDYFAVIANLDRQIGRVLDHLDETGLADNTLVIFASDNGPTSLPRYEVDGFTSPGSTGGLRGRKDCLYEGGIREPLLVRWPEHVRAGRVDHTSVITALDLLPTLCHFTGVSVPDDLDGENAAAAWLGRDWMRGRDMFWDFGRKRGPEKVLGRKGFVASPTLAMRRGDWKLLINEDGGGAELYHIGEDPWERHDLAAAQPGRVRAMSEEIERWLDTVSTPREWHP